MGAVRMPESVRTFADVRPDKAQALKVLEEAAEAFGAWQRWDEYARDYEEPELIETDISAQLVKSSVVAEVADVIQAACNLAAALGEDDLRRHMACCERRNEERGRY